MRIDIRELNCRWINLDTATDNAERMNNLCDKLEIKNNKRFSARVLPAPEGTRPSEKHYVGVAQSHIDCLLESRDNLPSLIFEDDVDVTEDFRPIIEVPDNTDAIYLGISHGDGRYRANDIGGGMARISEMLAAHAIIYLSKRYLDSVVGIANQCIHQWKRPFDCGTYMIQKDFNIIAPHKPFFYQKAGEDALNDWEALTRPPLKLANRQPVGPIGGQY